MDQDKLAVIDLGSNTFHLLIVQKKSSYPGFSTVLRKREYVYLAHGGVSRIDDAAFKRGIICLDKFSILLTKYHVNKIFCFGTAALRNAENSKDFIGQVKHLYDLEIELIDGIREAELIYKGVGLSNLPQNENILTVDIGGGSVEFVLSSNGKMRQSWSLDVGISVLRAKFPPNRADLLTRRKWVIEYLRLKSWDILKQVNILNPSILAGASGPFEILESMNGLKSTPKGNIITSHSALKLLDTISKTSLDNRAQMKGMPLDRADLSFESACLMTFVLQSVPSIQKIKISPYSLKEGAIREYFNLD